MIIKKTGVLFLILILGISLGHSGTVIINTILKANQIHAESYCDENGANCTSLPFSSGCHLEKTEILTVGSICGTEGSLQPCGDDTWSRASQGNKICELLGHKFWASDMQSSGAHNGVSVWIQSA